ncbi:MAG TPA: protein disulfide oxidoreductase [Chromatiales bacterium]|nr:protein disulfide oxidoreductase [Chromatiales bacterium]
MIFSVPSGWARRRARLLFHVVVLLLVFLAVRAWTQRDLVTGPAPPVEGRLLDGRDYRLARDPRRPLVLYFWASWCSICRLEQDTIHALAREYPVITVAMHSGTDDEVRTFLREQGLEFPVLNDPDGELAGRFGVTAVPVSFVIDRGNRIVFRETGYTTGAGLRLRLWLAR